MKTLICTLIALVISLPLHALTLKDFPTSKEGTWTSVYTYYSPDQTVEVTTDLKISHSQDGKHLSVSAYSKSEAFEDTAFSYYADLTADQNGKYPYHFMSSTGQKETGTIEIIDALTTKTTFTQNPGYAVCVCKIQSDTVIVGEEKTYDAEGNFLFKATFRNERIAQPE